VDPSDALLRAISIFHCACALPPFIIPAKVLVIDSESHAIISSFPTRLYFNSDYGSGLVFEIWTWDRRTTDERLHCLRCATGCYRQA